ncbi:hypothetical protein LZ554_000909 [Drepanopeziza brunnea f. sp. 'monogermtubi']|nr:hypothetical protein LZ554_000909 [Drepanopeziza brunnea f. sp. 'monogermtubi']
METRNRTTFLLQSNPELGVGSRRNHLSLLTENHYRIAFKMAKHVAKSERLWIEPLSIEDHLEAYHALNTDERVIRWSSHTGPRNSIEDTRALLISRQPSDEQVHVEMFAVMLPPPSDIDAAGKATFVGSIGIIRLAEDGQSAEVAYGMLPRYWGRGYAPEALKLLVEYYWNSDRRVQKDILSAGTEPGNVQSRRVLEKAGFTRGATVEKAFEARNSVTGEMEWRAAILWHMERPKA